MIRALFLSLLFMLSWPQHIVAETRTDSMTITVPETILQDALLMSLPIHLQPGSDSVDGTLVIKNIENFNLGDQLISGLITLAGEDMQVKTSVAGQSLRLKLGSMELTFNITAKSRYEEATQTLFITPVVSELSTASGQTGDELANLLVGLFNGRELPLTLDRLQPIITDIGSGKLVMTMHVTDVAISEELVTLHLAPKFKSMRSGNIKQAP